MTQAKKNGLRTLLALLAISVLAFFWALPGAAAGETDWTQNNLLTQTEDWNLQGDGEAARFDSGVLKVTNTAWAMYGKSFRATENEGGAYDKYTLRVTGKFTDNGSNPGGGTGDIEGGKIIFGSNSDQEAGSFFLGVSFSPAWGEYGVIAAEWPSGLKGAGGEYFEASGIGVLSKFPDGTTYEAGTDDAAKLEARNAYWSAEHTYELVIISKAGGPSTFAFSVDGVQLWSYWDNIQSDTDAIDPENCYLGIRGESGNDFEITSVLCSGTTEAGDPGGDQPGGDGPDPSEVTFPAYDNDLVEDRYNLIKDETMWILNYGQGCGNGSEFALMNTGGAAFADPIAPDTEEGFRYDIKVSATFTDTEGTMPDGGSVEGMQILLFGNSCLDTNTIIQWTPDQNVANYLAVQIAPQWGASYGVISLRTQADTLNFELESFGGETYSYDGWTKSERDIVRSTYWSMPHTYEITVTSADGISADFAIRMDGKDLHTFSNIDVSGYRFTEAGYFGMNGSSGNTVTVQEFAVNDAEVDLIENWQKPVLDQDHNLIGVSDNFAVSTPASFPGYVHFTEEDGQPVLEMDSMADVITAATYAPEKIQDETVTLTFRASLSEPQVFAPGGVNSRTRYASFGISLRRFPDRESASGNEANPFGSNNGNGYFLSISNGKLELMKAGRSVTDKLFLSQKADVNFCDGQEHTVEFSAVNVEGGVRLTVVIDGVKILGYTDRSAGDTAYASGEENMAAGYAGIYYTNDLKYYMGDPGPGAEDYVTIYQFGIGDRTNVKTVESITITAHDQDGPWEITDNKITISEYDNVILEGVVSPADAFNAGVLWSSSDSTVASVTSQGQLIGLQEGIVVITCTTENGAVSARLTVEVKFRDSQSSEDPGNQDPNGGGCNCGSVMNGSVLLPGVALLILSAAAIIRKGKRHEN